LPTFSVDDGFSYAVPDGLVLGVGSMVRVPLGSRRVRGYVVSVRAGEAAGLKPVVAVSGDYPVFDEALLQLLRWAALHYVAPLSVLLGRAIPPNLPRGVAAPVTGPTPQVASPLPELSREAAAGRHVRPTYLVRGGGYGDLIAGLAAEVVAAGRNVAVIAPTVHEATRLKDELGRNFGERSVGVSSALPAKEATARWVQANGSRGLIIVGTPEIALWPLGEPSLWVAVEEGRRAMKSKQTPTLQVKDVLRRRALVQRTTLALLGPVPTLDTLVRGAEVDEPAGRVWPLVELVDRRDDRVGAGGVGEQVVRAVRGVVQRDGQVFVFVTRRGYAPAFRCVRCRELRRCPECGAGPDRCDVCRRCGAALGPCEQCEGRRFEPLGIGLGRALEDLKRYLGGDRVGEVGSNRQILVGTERDLPYVPETALSVAVDADSLLLAPHYRAEEDAVRTLARVVLTVARGRGRRAMIQTSQPSHRALAALRGGHPLGYLRDLATERERDGLPPATELLAIEVRGDAGAAAADIAKLAGTRVRIHGPEEGGARTRWFLQAESLQQSRVLLRPMVQSWRDGGSTVRIDADPIDL
jgi:primosomal protein N' (replication factor Y)